MTLFAKAANGLNLTPFERAALKLVQGGVISVALAVIPAAAQGLLLIFGAASTAGFQWWPSLVSLGISLGHTALAAVNKYWTAHADAPLADVAAVVTSSAPSTSTPALQEAPGSAL